MKVAIYSRIIDYEQQNEVQRLFDELIRQRLQPVVHEPFLEKIKSAFVLPPTSAASETPATSTTPSNS
jgi:NAD+ kinase